MRGQYLMTYDWVRAQISIPLPPTTTFFSNCVQHRNSRALSLYSNCHLRFYSSWMCHQWSNPYDHKACWDLLRRARIKPRIMWMWVEGQWRMKDSLGQKIHLLPTEFSGRWHFVTSWDPGCKTFLLQRTEPCLCQVMEVMVSYHGNKAGIS